MNDIKMKTGGSSVEEPSDTVNAFMLAFMAIIWRRVWITTVIYCRHNEIRISRDVVLKALKYNIFSEYGIGNLIKPYVVMALKDGFLMPQVSRQNSYAKRAVEMFKPCYEMVTKYDREQQIEFIKEYALSVFDDNRVDDVIRETQDAMSDILSPNNNSNSASGLFLKKCDCKMCSMVDSWDIEIGLVYSEDPFKNTVMTGLVSALDQTVIN